MSALGPVGHCTSHFKRAVCISCRQRVDVHKGEGVRPCGQGKRGQKPNFFVDVINGWPQRASVWLTRWEALYKYLYTIHVRPLRSLDRRDLFAPWVSQTMVKSFTVIGRFLWNSLPPVSRNTILSCNFAHLFLALLKLVCFLGASRTELL